jgi:hypothetical protein
VAAVWLGRSGGDTIDLPATIQQASSYFPFSSLIIIIIIVIIATRSSNNTALLWWRVVAFTNYY